MNKTRFRLLVFFMSLSLVGIILVQLYWVNSSIKNNEEQFKFHIQQVLGKVAVRLQENDAHKFFRLYTTYKDSTGKAPSRKDMLPYYYNYRNNRKGENIIYSDNMSQRDYNLFFDKERVGNYFDDVTVSKAISLKDNPNNESEKASRTGDIQVWQRYQFDLYIKDFRDFNPLETRVSKNWLNKVLETELSQSGVNTPFEFGIYKNGLATKLRSGKLKWEDGISYQHPVYADIDGKSGYRLLITFPQKKTFIFSSILGITSLSLIFTLIIIIAYLSAINQLIKQKQISEIKTDFINNMTHEFKTPIATINLALDAIKNPKIFSDPEKVQRYLQMIRDENKRMHSQVENVLQISKLDKKELDINKDQADVHTVIEEAVEHINLIVEARNGTLTKYFNAQRTTALLNDVHFTNVLVNILDNAIKYSPDEPVIEIHTENVKDFILIKIKDNGLGMSKSTQKRIFEKFYREHTGDIHNVKGHGLGLAYVKRVLDDHNAHIYVESEKGKGSTFIIKMHLIN
ncbi:HAMP domain-containing histidine kinase [Flavobacterium salilacus subsp. salilacus]|uniref:sensor histidine kinase n=1 Tax=Flavobacterium TaxID=237 RepID=UPI00107565F2|nr:MULTISPECIES: HAMP domain-containing sensor histidine kinase [Flavobacterium]KAF2517501.1 HAMP domain-containing histidine kinase [Flavobacterium salilacus subsp. salilacus]MBE1615649.1 HAMP domain-containing histidine kinase [Flavobacterium sp. SaA2.13]NDI99721.1 HAMP domain-containing histidine kinase [Flavobacterium salilacus subsp. altitudinum]